MRKSLSFCVVGVFICLAFMACGPVQASTAIADGVEYLAQAEREGAQRYARYEYHKAQILLAEAKTKNGYGEYEIARRWASQAAALAIDAKKTAIHNRDQEQHRRKVRPLATPTNIRPQPPGQPTPEKATPPEKKRIERPLLPPNMQPGADR